MRKQQSTGRKARLAFKPSSGIMVSTAEIPYPRRADEKVDYATSIIQAILAAQESAALTGGNHDAHLEPLRMAARMLEHASRQLHSYQEEPHG